jgi:hypothetical protein
LLVRSAKKYHTIFDESIYPGPHWSLQLITWTILPLINSLLHQSFSTKSLLQAPIIFHTNAIYSRLLSGIYLPCSCPLSIPLYWREHLNWKAVFFQTVLVVAQFTSIILTSHGNYFQQLVIYKITWL